MQNAARREFAKGWFAKGGVGTERSAEIGLRLTGSARNSRRSAPGCTTCSPGSP